MMPTRSRWFVRQTVPTTYPQLRRFEGYTIERIRGPRQGIDRGLYLVRTPDGCSRTAILRGIQSGRDLQPHLVYSIRDRLELGAELAAFWPGRKHLPAVVPARHGVGDFAAAVQFACQAARNHLITSTTAPSPSHQEHSMQIRQGDVLLVPSTDPKFRQPTGAMTPVKSDVPGRVVLAYGEVTGHHHSVDAAHGSLATDEGGLTFLTIDEVIAPLEHQEHASIDLSPGVYEVRRQREWTDQDEPRQVAD